MFGLSVLLQLYEECPLPPHAHRRTRRQLACRAVAPSAPRPLALPRQEHKQKATARMLLHSVALAASAEDGTAAAPEYDGRAPQPAVLPLLLASGRKSLADVVAESSLITERGKRDQFSVGMSYGIRFGFGGPKASDR